MMTLIKTVENYKPTNENNAEINQYIIDNPLHVVYITEIVPPPNDPDYIRGYNAHSRYYGKSERSDVLNMSEIGDFSYPLELRIYSIAE